MKMTGAQIAIRLLERQGVELITGIPGGSNLPLYDALAQSSRIRHILARHEQGAGFIAQGLARATGQPAITFATSGPGATNLMTALADAKLDSIPLVCVTGQVPRAMIGTDAFQEVDTYGMSLPITKHNFLVRSAEELLEVVPRAFCIAVSGRPGPVLVDIPKDVQTETCEFDTWPDIGVGEAPPDIDLAVLDQAAEMIDRARRPIICLGGGIIQADAAVAASEFIARAAMPAAMTLLGLGAVAVEHPLSLGMLGMHAARYTNLVLEECDLFIAAGMRFDDRATGRVAQFCPQAKIIHIDIDAAEIDKLKAAHLAIVGDVGAALADLSARIENNGRGEWLERIAELKREYPLETPGLGDVGTPYGLIRTVARHLGDDAVVATDVGQHQMWVAQAYPFSRPRQLLTSGGLGTMGFGLPAAIGAALACPGRPVVSFSGDGSLLMNIQELATAAEEDVNVKIIVMNNNSLGLVRQQQGLFYAGRIFASEFRTRTDFARIAEGFGVRAVDLGRCDNPAAALAEALNHEGPCLINAPISAQEHVYPMVPPGAANREMIGGEINDKAYA